MVGSCHGNGIKCRVMGLPYLLSQDIPAEKSAISGLKMPHCEQRKHPHPALPPIYSCNTQEYPPAKMWQNRIVSYRFPLQQGSIYCFIQPSSLTSFNIPSKGYSRVYHTHIQQSETYLAQAGISHVEIR